MPSILDGVLVGLLLLLSIGYAVLSLGPRRLKTRILEASSRLAGRAPAFLGLAKVARSLSAASASKSAGACGGCDDCGSATASAPQNSSAEINVPVAKIGRRN